MTKVSGGVPCANWITTNTIPVTSNNFNNQRSSFVKLPLKKEEEKLKSVIVLYVIREFNL